MPKVKLDNTFVLTAQCPPDKRKIDYYDETVTSLILEVRKSGGRTFHIRYINQYNKLCQMKIGGAHEITLDQARKVAKRLRSEIVLGSDPAVKKAEKRSVPTYAELAADHLRHAQSVLKRPANTERVLRCHLIPAFKSRPIDTITQQDVVEFLAKKRKEGLAPATVEKLRVTLGRSYSLAKRWGFPGSDRNPVHGVPRPRGITGRQRFLTPEEAERLRQAVEASSNPMLAPIVGLLLLTACRAGELLAARFEDVDVDRQTWRIPESKNDTSRHVPLSSAAVAIIQKLPRYAESPYLFTNPKTMGRFVSIKKSWDTARKAAGLKEVRIHDLRHSSISMILNSGVDLYTVGTIAGHRDYRSTQIYAHVYNSTMLEAVEAGAQKLKGSWS